MMAKDFQYDGKWLSDYGCVTTQINPDDINYISGANIVFTKTSTKHGSIFRHINSNYDECITATFDIILNPDNTDNIIMSSELCRDLMRWLNRRQFHRLHFFSDSDTYFNASFNIEKIIIGGNLYGLHLTMETDSPFMYGYPEIYDFTVADTTESYYITNKSDYIGDTSIEMEITCNQSGNLTITNQTTGQATIINGCVSGEKITINGENLSVVTTASKNILNYFNFVFPRLRGQLSDRVNIYTISLPCTIQISYTPIYTGGI